MDGRYPMMNSVTRIVQRWCWVLRYVCEIRINQQDVRRTCNAARFLCPEAPGLLGRATTKLLIRMIHTETGDRIRFVTWQVCKQRWVTEQSNPSGLTSAPNTLMQKENMVDSITPSLVTLPIELFCRVLDYLDPVEILLSVRDVCARLNAITDTYQPYLVNAISRTTSRSFLFSRIRRCRSTPMHLLRFQWRRLPIACAETR